MKEVTLKIPEKKFKFFVELMNQLGFEVTNQASIPEWQKEQLDLLLEKHESETANYTNWESVKEDL